MDTCEDSDLYRAAEMIEASQDNLLYEAAEEAEQQSKLLICHK